ncbi:hypothetical protein [Candidatus Poseidonia alphae]|uniref:GHMP family kinase ATP-binding protein n=1 Tax=Candidatus Poseidonia alphae TaxID=1915863 RepID=UPI0030C6F1C8
MGVLGKGTAHGACSLLHAAALGYGASIALDLPMTVRLLDKKSKRDVHDHDNLFASILQVWMDAGLALPKGFTSEQLHWGVNSKIPPQQGLKSSSALCVAAFRALGEATEIEVSDELAVELSGHAQIAAGVSMTGSLDDAWACATKGWKLIDPQAEVQSGILLEGSGPNPSDWTIILVLRGARKHRPTFEDFVPHTAAFQQALSALQNNQELVALTWNGRGMVAVLGDTEGRKMTNDSFVNSARAAGVTGSGPALVIVVPSQQKPTIERIKSWYGIRYKDAEIIETAFLSSQNDGPEE